MEFDIDLSTVPEPRPIPDGVGIGRVLSVEKKPTQSGGEKLTYTIELEAPEEQKKEVGKIWIDFSLSPGALMFLKRFFRAFDYEPKGKFDAEVPVGKRFGFACSIDDDPEWGVRNRFNAYFKADNTVPAMKRSQADVDALVEASQSRVSGGGDGDAKGGKGSKKKGGAAGDATPF